MRGLDRPVAADTATRKPAGDEPSAAAAPAPAAGEVTAAAAD
jgi:hypothetical protein